MSSACPATYPRRLLFVVCGLSPQILTETLYGLAVTTVPAFVPTEIQVLTTAEGAHRAQLMLLHADSGQFYRLCRDYQLPDIQFTVEHISKVCNRRGEALDDIRTPEDNECLADAITAAICRFTQDPQTALHVSIAGGRKTMGYYAGYALSLLGRDQDRLSHVLVTSHYESHPEFFYPTPYSHLIYTRENRPLDTREAEISLAEIPFIRLRNDIPKRLLNGEAGFSEIIRLARIATEVPRLHFDQPRCKLMANGIAIPLQQSQLAFYLWVVCRTVFGNGALPIPGKLQPDRQYADEFMHYYQTITGHERDIEKTRIALKNGMDEQFFQEKISRINTILVRELGRRLAGHFRIDNRGRRGQSNYHVTLTARQITGFECLGYG